jgi:hypothetical protein
MSCNLYPTGLARLMDPLFLKSHLFRIMVCLLSTEPQPRPTFLCASSLLAEEHVPEELDPPRRRCAKQVYQPIKSLGSSQQALLIGGRVYLMRMPAGAPSGWHRASARSGKWAKVGLAASLYPKPFRQYRLANATNKNSFHKKGQANRFGVAWP